MQCPAACGVSATLTADKATARKLRLRGSAKIGAGSRRLKAAGTAKVALKLSPKVAKRLKRMRGAKGTVKVTVTGADGSTRTASKPVRLGR